MMPFFQQSVNASLKVLGGGVLSLVLSAGSAQSASAPLEVVASFSILGDITSQIGKERVHVTTLVGPLQDSHSYQLRPQDMKTLSKASLLVLNGRGFEGWMERLSHEKIFKGQSLTLLAPDPTAAGADDHDHEEHDHHHEHDEGHHHDHRQGNPHQWHNPEVLKQYADKIATALSAQDPAGKDFYGQNAAAWKQALDARVQPLQAKVRGLSETQKGCQFIVMHEAFDSLGAAYGCRFTPIQGANVEAEPSAKTMATLITQIREAKAKVIFQEPVASEKLLTQLTRETGVTIYPLYSDYLSSSTGPAPTVLDMVSYNGAQLVKALEKNGEK